MASLLFTALLCRPVGYLRTFGGYGAAHILRGGRAHGPDYEPGEVWAIVLNAPSTWAAPAGTFMKLGDWRSGSAFRSHRRGRWFEPSIAHLKVSPADQQKCRPAGLFCVPRTHPRLPSRAEAVSRRRAVDNSPARTKLFRGWGAKTPGSKGGAYCRFLTILRARPQV